MNNVWNGFVKNKNRGIEWGNIPQHCLVTDESGRYYTINGRDNIKLIQQIENNPNFYVWTEIPN